jgi:PTH1 family peptidyl-tRNA hydrolase
MSKQSEEQVGARRWLILGLGNPGECYRRTRHNLGFRVVEAVARRREIRVDTLECNSLVGGDSEVMLAVPQTYMNRSGYAARCLVERYGFDASSILVVYDDVHLPLGALRLRTAGSPGGHRGMESILENLRTDAVPRLRMGISEVECPTEGEELVEFVLSPFSDQHQELVEEMILRARDACQTWLEEGAEVAMNRFNG